MHKLSIELVEHLADLLQTGRSSPNYKLTVYRQKDGGYENFPFVLPEAARITIDRRWNMAADELTVEMVNTNGHYSPDYSINKSYREVSELPLSGYSGVIHAYNKITCDLGYGSELVPMFTGQLQNIDIVESPPTIKFNALNAYRKLLKPIDPIDSKELVYENESALNIIKDLCTKAGVDEMNFNDVEESDFILKNIMFPFGMDYSEAVRRILQIMGRRIVGGRNGIIHTIKSELYSQKDFHNWEFDDFVNLTEGSYKIDVSIIRNRVIIQSNNGWQAFEDPFLVDYCNKEIIPSSVEAPWAETLEQKWAVADQYFLAMRRRLRRLTVAIRGNPSMDIGDLVKTSLLTSTANAKYMIVAIQSDFSPKGYIDQVDLEYVDIATGHLCQPADGKYESNKEEESESNTTTVVMDLRDKIVDYAKSFMGKYYQWQGNYPDNSEDYGLDNSHFTYQTLKKFDLMDSYLTAAQQKDWCNLISREELLPGDLIFYTWGGSIVKHVVMYIGNGQIIGANGGGSNTTTIGIAQEQKAMVKIDRIDYGPPAYFGRAPGLV